VFEIGLRVDCVVNHEHCPARIAKNVFDALCLHGLADDFRTGPEVLRRCGVGLGGFRELHLIHHIKGKREAKSSPRLCAAVDFALCGLRHAADGGDRGARTSGANTNLAGIARKCCAAKTDTLPTVSGSVKANRRVRRQFRPLGPRGLA
jgi:hypothetical protein